MAIRSYTVSREGTGWPESRITAVPIEGITAEPLDGITSGFGVTGEPPREERIDIGLGDPNEEDT